MGLRINKKLIHIKTIFLKGLVKHVLTNLIDAVHSMFCVSPCMTEVKSTT